MTHFHSVPETGDGIVILTNSQRSWPFFSEILGDWAAWCGLPGWGWASSPKDRRYCGRSSRHRARGHRTGGAPRSRCDAGPALFRPARAFAQGASRRAVRARARPVRHAGVGALAGLPVPHFGVPCRGGMAGYATALAAAVLAASAVLPETEGSSRSG
jgi:hypothetical protein